MKIAVLGGGNMGLCLVGEITKHTSHDVFLYTSKSHIFSSTLQVVNSEENLIYTSGNFTATNSIQQAMEGTDVIFCTIPAMLREETIRKLEPYISPSAMLGFVPAYGGAEYYCGNLLDKGVTVFGLQKVPYIARTRESGKVAGLLSKKPELKIAAIPIDRVNDVCNVVEELLQIPCTALPNFLSAAIMPGNPLLHTSGAYVYLKDYTPEQRFDDKIYYWQQWHDECSDVLLSFSDEMIAICNKIPIDLSAVQSVQEYYGVSNSAEATRKFHSIPSFKIVTLPLVKEENGYRPDFQARFFTEDIPFGVCILKGLALIVGVETPTIDTILAWYKRMTGKCYFDESDAFGKDIQETAIPQRFDIHTKEDVAEFYCK